MFAKMNHEPLIFSTDKDGTYNVPSTRAFHLSITFPAHKQEYKKKSVVKSRMPPGVKNRQTDQAYIPRDSTVN